MLTGVYKPDDGTITLDGKNITGKKTIEINREGIARTFQNIRLFKELSVLDNVKAGLHNHYKYSALTGILRLPGFFKAEKAMNEKAMELLAVFDPGFQPPLRKTAEAGDCQGPGDGTEAAAFGRTGCGYESQ